MKLSPAQRDIVFHLQKGWRLTTLFGFRSDPTTHYLSRSSKEGGVNFKNVRGASIWKLEELGVLFRTQSASGNNYELTQLGEDLKV